MASLPESQQKQLQAIRDLFRGKTMLVEGGAWTAEAREPQRHLLVLKQLELAKQLRHQLESAAAKASTGEKSAFEIQGLIRQQSLAMNQLVSLTEAVQGNYVLNNDYQEYNELTVRTHDRHQRQLEHAKMILRDQMKRMAYPDREWPLRTAIDPEPEPAPAPAPAPAPSPPSPVAAAPATRMPWKQPEEEVEEEVDVEEAIPAWAKGAEDLPDPSPPDPEVKIPKRVVEPKLSPTRKVTLIKPKQWEGGVLDIRSHVLAMHEQLTQRDQNNKKKKKKKKKRKGRSPQSPDDNTSTPSENKKRRRSEASSERSGSARYFDRSSLRTLPPPVDEVARARSSREPSPLPEPIVHHPPRCCASASDVSPDPVASSHVHFRRSRRSMGPKKCHTCKTYRPNYLKCHFFLPTGCKCGKYYCMECVTKEYDSQFDPSNRNEWHCPSCLGTCKCEPCVRQRTREERRSQFEKEGSHRSNPKRGLRF